MSLSAPCIAMRRIAVLMLALACIACSPPPQEPTDKPVEPSSA